MSFFSCLNTMPSKGTKKAAKMGYTERSPGAEELATASYTNSLDPAFCQVIREVTENILKMIDEKLAPHSRTLQNHTLELKNLDTRTTEAEGRVSVVETVTDQAQSCIWALEKQVQNLSDYIDDLENRGRRKNVRIIGLPEGTEGSQPAKFFKGWLPNFLDLETKAGRITVERAHQTLAPKPGPSQCSRPVLVRFHNFGDKQRAMEALRHHGTDAQALIYEGFRFMLFSRFFGSRYSEPQGIRPGKEVAERIWNPVLYAIPSDAENHLQQDHQDI
ncbi:uncharacterized protein LOC132394632 [Hypanus sabinus]|uniref:uncharacterized protein LOC132394632 n=1 Tax=Hypanus sabinus TaxID=79690 RepID=UPI0028C4815A|nr:uncharacterized protein LOC132394632 [Hypanus sabinus]